MQITCSDSLHATFSMKCSTRKSLERNSYRVQSYKSNNQYRKNYYGSQSSIFLMKILLTKEAYNFATLHYFGVFNFYAAHSLTLSLFNNSPTLFVTREWECIVVQQLSIVDFLKKNRSTIAALLHSSGFPQKVYFVMIVAKQSYSNPSITEMTYELINCSSFFSDTLVYSYVSFSSRHV